MKKVEKYLLESLDKKGALLAALIDPLDYPSLETAIKSGAAAAKAGADYILVGGSVGVGGELLDTVVKEIKSQISIPLVLFPGNVTTVSKYADALYFMSMLNSRNPYWISGAQVLAAPTVRSLGIEALSLGYIVCEPGGTVGWVGDANLIPRSKPSLAAASAMAAQLMGSHFVLSDSGSNPQNGPIPPEMAKAVASSISIPYIIGGGVRTPAQAKTLVKAGADILQVGTALESGTVLKTVSSLANAIHAAGKGRKKKFSI
ncbi:geranylgeranylglyceryl/heptaprenylglyceryl phosphate synthase [Candidatus Micrarchaeota archaeon CG10_big_fil_rev_8_21_14_0_10_45_29]|nr:MAG: geranylgeranylglyceryl/heptaprenylglyceryl phosphate synthase [Candidatus Micrarchaeota archaeon CG10_big_fil_rev_8_21_14_0_10_45_29]